MLQSLAYTGNDLTFIKKTSLFQEMLILWTNFITSRKNILDG